MRYIVLFFIKMYQKTLSPNHGVLKNYLVYYKCKFYPTCSEYSYQAIKKYGVVKGLFIGFKRIGRCNPWNEGGCDYLK